MKAAKPELRARSGEDVLFAINAATAIGCEDTNFYGWANEPYLRKIEIETDGNSRVMAGAEAGARRLHRRRP
jgi:hypothetical protein